MSVTPQPCPPWNPVLPAVSASCDFSPARLFRHCPVPFRCSKPTQAPLLSFIALSAIVTIVAVFRRGCTRTSTSSLSVEIPAFQGMYMYQGPPLQTLTRPRHTPPPGTWRKYLVPDPLPANVQSDSNSSVRRSPARPNPLPPPPHRPSTPSLPPPPTPPTPRDRDTGDGRTPRATRASTLFEFSTVSLPPPRHFVLCVTLSLFLLHVPNVKCQKVNRRPGLPCEEPAACFILRRPSQLPAPLFVDPHLEPWKSFRARRRFFFSPSRTLPLIPVLFRRFEPIHSIPPSEPLASTAQPRRPTTLMTAAP